MSAPLTPAELHMLADEAELEAERLQRLARTKLRLARILRDRAREEFLATLEPAS
jgi:hypothetical protein